MSEDRNAAPLVVAPGTVFGFRTQPLFEDSPPETGRYGAVVVLSRSEDTVAVGVLDGVWTSMPSLEEVEHRELLRRNRFFFKNNVAVIGCAVDEVPALEDFTEIGRMELSEQQQRFGKKYMGVNPVGVSYGVFDGVAQDVEGEWRWEHDREALLREHDAREKRREEARVKAEQRYETRLKDLTWDQLLSEDPFASWSPSPPYPPQEFRDAAVRRVHETYRLLQALGAKPRKPATRKILKDLVLWFNDADAAAGGVIETVEREDISVVLEEIAHVAGHPTLIEEVAAWRDW